jgi:hypothetical protein
MLEKMYSIEARSMRGIEDWINNCKNKNDWPLRFGHLLYYNSLS